MGKRSIVHVDIAAVTPKESSEFYQAVFGWEPSYHKEADYYRFKTEDSGGEFVEVGKNDVKQGDIIFFIGSDDVEADLKAVEACGGKRLTDVIPMPGFGEMAYFADPAGNKIGLWHDLSGS